MSRTRSAIVSPGWVPISMPSVAARRVGGVVAAAGDRARVVDGRAVERMRVRPPSQHPGHRAAARPPRRALMASIPRSGADPWAARPWTTMSSQPKPWWVTIARPSPNGSTTMRGVHRVPRHEIERTRPTSPPRPSRTRRPRRHAGARPERTSASSTRTMIADVALVVGGAEADHPVALDDRRHRAPGPARVADGIDMGVEAQRRARRPSPRQPGDDVRPPGRDFVDDDLDAQRAQPLDDEGGDGALARRARDEPRVARVDPDEIGEERLELARGRSVMRSVRLLAVEPRQPSCRRSP